MIQSTIGSGFSLPTASDGNLAVSNQSATTPPVDAIFARPLSTFTIATDVTASTVSTLNYDFVAGAGHSIVIGNEIVLQDLNSDRSFFAVVLDVVTNTITVDRPIDFAFPSATTTGTRVNTNMAVNGSSTPVIYNLYFGGSMIDMTRMIVKLVDDAVMNTATFGGIAALTRGIVFRSNRIAQTIFNFKTNGDIQSFCFDAEYTEDGLPGPSGIQGLALRITFGSIGKHGTIFQAEQPTDLQWIVQDDLTDLESCRVIAQGREKLSTE